MEIKARTALISVLQQADAFYHNQRGEVKVVANVSVVCFFLSLFHPPITHTIVKL